MGEYFAHHFTEDSTTRNLRGFNFDGKAESASGMLEKILIEKKIVGGNQKGYYCYNLVLPKSVSFSDVSLENVNLLVDDRSAYGLAFEKSRFRNDCLKKVIYLDDGEIDSSKSNNHEKYLIDLCRPEGNYSSGGFERKPYDYSWQKELRVKLGNLNFDAPDFVFVPNCDERKRFNEEFGVEAFNIEWQFAMMTDFVKEFGKKPKFEKLFYEIRKEVKKENQGSNNFLMKEVSERTWDKIYDLNSVSY